MNERIEAFIRLRDAARFRADADRAAAGIRNIGDSADSANRRGLTEMRAGASSLHSMLGVLATGAKLAAVGIGGLAAVGGYFGIKFNATMESNTVAFANFLGSEKAARTELDYLYKVAATTPFEFPDLVNGARRLLAFGMNAKGANKWLGTIGDTVAGIGGGTEEINRMVAAIGQIQAKGKLSTEELLQLAELGIPAFDAVAKGTGRSMDQLFSDLQAGTITAQEALPALQKSLRETFGGASAKQAQTFNGQLSTLKDNAVQAMGALTEPLFNLLRSNVFPFLNKQVGSLAGFLKGGGLGRMGAAITAGFEDRGGGFTGFLGLLSKIGGVASTVFPIVGKAVSAVVGYVKDFIDAAKPLAPFFSNVLGPILKGFAVGVLFGLIGLFKLGLAVFRVVAQVLGWIGEKAKPLSPILTAVGAVFGFLATGPLLGMLRVGRLFAPLFSRIGEAFKWVGGIFRSVGSAIGSVFTRLGSLVGRVVSGITKTLGRIVSAVKGLPGKVATAAAGLWNGLKSGLIGVVNFIVGKLNGLIDIVNKIPGVSIGKIGRIVDAAAVVNANTAAYARDPGIQTTAPRHRARGGFMGIGESAIVGERGMERMDVTPWGAAIRPVGSTNVRPIGGQFHVTVHSHVHMNRREVGRAVATEIVEAQTG